MEKKEQYTGSILVIGDEILSGRTQDTNSNHIAKKMTEIGINISEIRVIPDNKEIIIKSINELRKKLPENLLFAFLDLDLRFQT